MMSNVTKGNIGSNNHNMILLKVDVEMLFDTNVTAIHQY